MNKLKTIRLKFNYTTQDMADFLGISKTFYWQIENGTRTLSYNMAIKISIIFNLKPDDIFYNDYKIKQSI
ncbi:MAG: helix-turn-helix transcriptional regulator [Bacilli bacterium]|nr:helix-turn-helix transcriptional regulator [Bacilli bacterium]